MRTALLRMALVALAVVLASTLRSSQPALALHHFAEVSEVMSGFNGNPNVQYLEINQRAVSQNFVANSRVSVFNPDGTLNAVLLLIPSSPNPPFPNSGNGVKWIVGTTAFEMAAGIQADFEMPAGILPSSGMVCFGAPALLPPSDPNSWSASSPNNYVDCVAYGSMAGATPNIPPLPPGTNTNTPTSLSAGDCQRSLTRTTGTTFLAPDPPDGTWADTESTTDFALANPSPTNNAGQNGTLTATDTDSDTEADCRDNDDDNDGVKDASDNCPRTLGGDADQTDADADLAGVPCDPDDTVVDFDLDGCADGEELRLNIALGGGRNPSNFWDFFDTPDPNAPPGAPNYQRDKAITVADVFRVAARFGATGTATTVADALSAAPASGYHAGYDRSTVMGKRHGPADGAVAVADVFAVASSFGHSCTASP